MASAPQVEELVQKSGFIFVGTLERFGAATVPNLEIQAGTAVVRVSQVLQAPLTVTDLTNKQITVVLSDPQSVKVGDEAIFFADGVVYGKSIAVEEVAPPQVVKAPAKTEQVARLAEAVRKGPDLHLLTHAADSDLVVVGKVAEVRRVAPTGRSLATFDYPDWHEAVIQVESVEAGTFDQKTITIYFPASEDVTWYQAPKFQVGDEGAFFLHKHEVEELNKQAYVVLHAYDFHPRDRVQRIRTLIKQTPGGA